MTDKGFFFSCFQSLFPNKRKSAKAVMVADSQVNRGKKKSRWFFWSRIGRTRTVPIDHRHLRSADHDQTNGNQFNSSSLNSKPRSHQKLLPTRQNPVSFHNISADDQTPKEIVEQSDAGSGEKQKIVLEKSKSCDGYVDSSTSDTCHVRSSSHGREIYAKRSGFRYAGSPDIKHGAVRVTALSHSVSLPTGSRTSEFRVTFKKTSAANQDNNRRVDTAAAMSIIAVTLIIMLLWGRLCAILCASALVYFVPRQQHRNQRTVKNNWSGSGGGDLSSEEYKKRVVLEGFLERNHRGAC